MSIVKYDLTNVLSRMNLDESCKTVTINGLIIAFCYPDASFGPREIIDDEYWEDALEYIYGIAMQTDFGFPMIRQTETVPAEELLAIQLVRIRHDLLPIAGYIAEYTRIYVMGHAAFFPRNRLREAIGISDFDYFVADYSAKRVTYTVGQDAYTIDMLDDVELHTWMLVEEALGNTNAWNAKNEDFVMNWLTISPPYLNEDPANERDEEVNATEDDEFRRRVKGNMMSKLRMVGWGG